MTGYVTIRKFGEEVGLGRPNVLALLDAGTLPHLKVGKRQRLIPVSALVAFQRGEILTTS